MNKCDSQLKRSTTHAKTVPPLFQSQKQTDEKLFKDSFCYEKLLHRHFWR